MVGVATTRDNLWITSSCSSSTRIREAQPSKEKVTSVISSNRTMSSINPENKDNWSNLSWQQSRPKNWSENVLSDSALSSQLLQSWPIWTTGRVVMVLWNLSRKKFKFGVSTGQNVTNLRLSASMCTRETNVSFFPSAPMERSVYSCTLKSLASSLISAVVPIATTDTIWITCGEPRTASCTPWNPGSCSRLKAWWKTHPCSLTISMPILRLPPSVLRRSRYSHRKQLLTSPKPSQSEPHGLHELNLVLKKVLGKKLIKMDILEYHALR